MKKLLYISKTIIKILIFKIILVFLSYIIEIKNYIKIQIDEIYKNINYKL